MAIKQKTEKKSTIPEEHMKKQYDSTLHPEEITSADWVKHPMKSYNTAKKNTRLKIEKNKTAFINGEQIGASNSQKLVDMLVLIGFVLILLLIVKVVG